MDTAVFEQTTALFLSRYSKWVGTSWKLPYNQVKLPVLKDDHNAGIRRVLIPQHLINHMSVCENNYYQTGISTSITKNKIFIYWQRKEVDTSQTLVWGVSLNRKLKEYGNNLTSQ